MPTPIASYLKGIYPIHYYLEPSKSVPCVTSEVHISIADSDGYCDQCICNKCPIESMCDINIPNTISLSHFFPELTLQHPEYFI